MNMISTHKQTRRILHEDTDLVEEMGERAVQVLDEMETYSGEHADKIRRAMITFLVGFAAAAIIILFSVLGPEVASSRVALLVMTLATAILLATIGLIGLTTHLLRQWAYSRMAKSALAIAEYDIADAVEAMKHEDVSILNELDRLVQLPADQLADNLAQYPSLSKIVKRFLVRVDVRAHKAVPLE